LEAQTVSNAVKQNTGRGQKALINEEMLSQAALTSTHNIWGNNVGKGTRGVLTAL